MRRNIIAETSGFLTSFARELFGLFMPAFRRGRRSPRSLYLEALECRQLLSGSPPTVVAVLLPVPTNGSLTLTAADFDNAYTDPENDPLDSVQFTGLPTDPSDPNFGKLTLTLNGTTAAVANNDIIVASELPDLTYTPSSDFQGVFSFSWQASDGTSFSSAAGVDLTVELPHTVGAISKVVDENQPLTFAATDFSTSSVYTGAALQGIQIETLPAHGTLTLNGTAVTAGTASAVISVDQISTLLYTPDSDFIGTDSFTFAGWDGTNFSTPASGSAASVGLSVVTLPAISDISKSGASGIPIAFSPVDFTAHYTGGQALSTVTIVTIPAHGSLLIANGSGSSVSVVAGQTFSANQLSNLSLVESNGFSGTDSFHWEASDGVVTSPVANVDLTVNPALGSITQATDQGISVNFSASTFTNAYTGSAMSSVQIRRLPTHGQLLLTVGSGHNATSIVKLNQVIPVAQLGGLTYKPAAKFQGSDSLLLTASDGTENSASATVSLTVTVPSVNDFSTDVGENKAFNFATSDFSTFFQGAGTMTLFKVLSLPTHGSLTLGSGSSSTFVTVNETISTANLGNLIYTPAANYLGPDTFRFTGSDGLTASDGTFDFARAPGNVDLTVRSLLITANNGTIENNSTTPSADNFTDFGNFTTNAAYGGVTRTYTIQNLTGTLLNLTDVAHPVEISGPDAADFTVTTAPANAISTGTAATTTFTITFRPTSSGLKRGTVTIPYGPDSSSTSTFVFSIQGTGIQTDTINGPAGAPTEIATANSSTAGQLLQSSNLNSSASIGTTLIVALNISDDGGGAVTVSDGHGDNFTLDADVTNPGHTRTMVFSLPVTSTALATSDHISASFANSVTNAQMEVYKVGGLVSAAPKDQSHTATGDSNAPDSGLTATTAQANELLFGAIGIDAGSVTISPGALYSSLDTQNTSNITLGAEYQITNAAGAVHANGTLSSGSAQWSAVVVAYKANTGNGPLVATTQNGKGPGAVNGDIIHIVYTGTLADGTVFDASSKRGGIPIAFRLDDSGNTHPFITNNTVNTVLNTTVIDGWEYGLQGIKVGEHRTLIIPSLLAYGDQGQTGIPGGATLIFDVVCVAIDGGPSFGVTNQTTGASVLPGDADPSTFNGTDFGTLTLGESSVSQSFSGTDNSPDNATGVPSATIQNLGFAVTGADPKDFTATGGFTQFTLVFKPTGPGVRTAIIHFLTNDPQHPDFAFAVRGTAPSDFADLIVSGFGEKPFPSTTLANGDVTTTIPVIIENMGNAPIPSSTPSTDITITVSNGTSNAPITINTNTASTFSLAGLGSNKTKQINVPITIPGNLTAADYTYTVTVNSTNAIAESVTTNNSSTSSGFNLTGSLISSTIPAILADNGSINGSVVVNVTNNGTFAMPSGETVSIQLQAVGNGQTLTLGAPQTFKIGGLLPVDSFSTSGHSMKFTIPVKNAPAIATDGAYQIQAVITSGIHLLETSASDNTFSTTLQGSHLTFSSHAPGVDLTAAFANTSQPVTTSGTSVHLTMPVIITNIGTASVPVSPSSTTDVEIFANSSTGALIGHASVDLSRLASGKNKTVNVDVTEPASGLLTYFVEVNTSNSVTETSTINNTATTSTLITASLASSTLPASVNSTASATSGTVTLSVRSAGKLAMPSGENVEIQIVLVNASTNANIQLNGSGQTFTAANGSRALTVSIPSGLATGSYFVEANLILTPAILESASSNNLQLTNSSDTTLTLTVN